MNSRCNRPPVPAARRCRRGRGTRRHQSALLPPTSGVAVRIPPGRLPPAQNRVVTGSCRVKPLGGKHFCRSMHHCGAGGWRAFSEPAASDAAERARTTVSLPLATSLRMPPRRLGGAGADTRPAGAQRLRRHSGSGARRRCRTRVAPDCASRARSSPSSIAVEMPAWNPGAVSRSGDTLRNGGQLHVRAAAAAQRTPHPGTISATDTPCAESASIAWRPRLIERRIARVQARDVSPRPAASRLRAPPNDPL